MYQLRQRGQQREMLMISSQTVLLARNLFTRSTECFRKQFSMSNSTEIHWRLVQRHWDCLRFSGYSGKGSTMEFEMREGSKFMQNLVAAQHASQKTRDKGPKWKQWSGWKERINLNKYKVLSGVFVQRKVVVSWAVREFTCTNRSEEILSQHSTLAELIFKSVTEAKARIKSKVL